MLTLTGIFERLRGLLMTALLVLLLVVVPGALAQTATPTDDDDRDDRYFYGVLESLTEIEAVVSGRSFVVQARTEIDGDVAVGIAVEVEYRVIDGQDVADEIDDLNDDDDDDDDNYYFFGLLESLDETTAVVSGHSFRLASNVEIDDDVEVGEYVEVEFILIDNLPVAVEIDDTDDDDDDDRCFDDRPSNWTTYRVSPGDTLSSIASAAGISVRDLVYVNCLRNASFIVIGQILFVPGDLDTTRIIRIDDDDDDDDNGRGGNDDRGRDDDDDNDDDRGRDDDDDDDDDRGQDDDDDGDDDDGGQDDDD
jgi:hypothetical protein